jgi:ActR/RegA family two-component response regulator
LTPRPQRRLGDTKAITEMNETILIIDTDNATRERLRDILVSHGHTMEIVESSADALAAVEHTPWPLVVCVFKPGDANGPALVQAILARAPDTAVIVVGDREQATALAALRGGATDYLPLPLDESELVAALDRAWRMREQRRLCQARQVGAEEPAADARQQRLVATLAHEINNPLTPIIGLAEMLLEDLPPDHPSRAYVRAISAAAWRIRDVVRNLCEETESQGGEKAMGDV